MGGIKGKSSFHSRKSLLNCAQSLLNIGRCWAELVVFIQDRSCHKVSLLRASFIVNIDLRPDTRCNTCHLPTARGFRSSEGNTPQLKNNNNAQKTMIDYPLTCSRNLVKLNWCPTSPESSCQSQNHTGSLYRVAGTFPNSEHKTYRNWTWFNCSRKRSLVIRLSHGMSKASLIIAQSQGGTKGIMHPCHGAIMRTFTRLVLPDIMRKVRHDFSF